MTETERAYLAGLLDGEGTIMIYQHGTNGLLRVVVSNTWMPVVDWCREITNAGFVMTEDRRARGHKSVARWVTSMRPAAAVLSQVQPYMKIKAAHAELAVEYVAHYRQVASEADRVWQEEYRQRMLALNARPSPELKQI